MPHQRVQQIKLLRGHLYRFPVPSDLTGANVKAYVQHLVTLFHRVVAAQDSIHPRLQFQRMKGLQHIVLCPETQPAHPVLYIDFRSQIKDWRQRLFPLVHVLHQFKAVQARQHYIQYHQVKLPYNEEFLGLGSIITNTGFVIRNPQCHLNELGDGYIIFNYQNLEAHTTSFYPSIT